MSDNNKNLVMGVKPREIRRQSVYCNMTGVEAEKYTILETVTRQQLNSWKTWRLLQS
jgi:hypothetical protein